MFLHIYCIPSCATDVPDHLFQMSPDEGKYEGSVCKRFGVPSSVVGPYVSKVPCTSVVDVSSMVGKEPLLHGH